MKFLRPAVGFSFLLMLGCSSTPTVVGLPKSANPDQEISRVETRIKDADSRQMDVCSPNNFEDASDSLDKAKEGRNRGSGSVSILHKVALSEAYLGKAEAVCAKTTQIMPGVVSARKRALQANAAKYFPAEIQHIDDSMRDATAALESDNSDLAEKTKATLQARYEDLAGRAERQYAADHPAPAQPEEPQVSANEKLNQDYQLARKELSPDEAEVYMQGDALLLRLKGINFTSGNATLSANDPVAIKTQKLLKEIEPSDLTIVGHTDSTGSKRINKRLSLERAQAVGDFLVSQNVVNKDQVTTKGSSDTKPVSSNKTEDGRAQNRRVDIIVTL